MPDDAGDPSYHKAGGGIRSPYSEEGSEGCRPRLLSITLLLAACGEGANSGPAAEACAEVVKIYRDLQGEIEIVSRPQQGPEGRVEIRYGATGAMNLPVERVAECTFAPGAGGSLELVAAVVDGQELEASEIAAASRALGGDR
jgi:hypothetical protein